MEDFKIDKFSKEIRLINQNHFLSLRKQLKNNEYYNKNYHLLKKIETDNDIINKINIDIKKIKSKIDKDKLYELYENCKEEIPKLGYLMQMIITQDNNLIIFGLYQINEYLINTSKSDFLSKNLKIQFNENMFKYLFDLFDNKYKENDIALLLTFIVDKLCQLDKQYCIWLMNYIDKIISLIKLVNNKEKNNLIYRLYILINNIFLLDNNEINKNILENDNKQFLHIVINEIYNINNNNNNESFIISRKLISILLTILNNIFVNRLFISYIFVNADKIKRKDKNIFDAIKYILINQTNYEVVDSSIICLYNFIDYYIENKEILSEKDQDEIEYRLCHMKIPKSIIPFIYDNKDNILNNDIKIYIFKILINTIYIGTYDYWCKLIEKNLISQLVKLQNFLFATKIDTNSSLIFEYHLLLIFNLVSTEAEEVIYNIAISSPCISNLFKFFNLNNYHINKQLDLFLNILHSLIKNKCKFRKNQHNFRYVKTFLLSEGICEFYLKLLLDEKVLNQDLIKNIFIDILELIHYFKGFVKKGNEKDNIVLLHLLKIGMNDIINSYKSKINYSNELIYIIEDISKEFNV